MAVEDYIAQATSDIEAEKPIKKFVDGVESELTDAEYDIKINKLATVLDDEAQNGYKRKRALDYPSIPDQLDDIFHNGLDAWKATIQETKDKYPKG